MGRWVSVEVKFEREEISLCQGLAFSLWGFGKCPEMASVREVWLINYQVTVNGTGPKMASGHDTYCGVRWKHPPPSLPRLLVSSLELGFGNRAMTKFEREERKRMFCYVLCWGLWNSPKWIQVIWYLPLGCNKGCCEFTLVGMSTVVALAHGDQNGHFGPT